MSKTRTKRDLAAIGGGPVSVDEAIDAVASGKASGRFETLYGGDADLIEDRQATYLRALRAFRRQYGADRGVILVRAPARINLMGVHVEHRRGEVNYVTHRREILMIAEPRDDDTVVMNNISGAFPERTFSIAKELKRARHTDWLKYIDSARVNAALEEARGDWVNYVKSAVLRLQFLSRRKRLCGMNLMVAGDIPQSAGLSSSSALVVTSALATVNLNGLKISRGDLSVLCGEGEWYVGTRGGAGDHAAMIMGRRGYVSHLRFFPFELLQYVPLPTSHSVVICNSLRRAKKSGDELSAYNETIAAYGTVLMLMKDILEKHFGYSRSWLNRHVKHLGDFNLDRKRFPDGLLYQVLQHMPTRISRRELRNRLPHEAAALRRTFRTHNNPADGYRARAVGMFGLAEIARGAACVVPLKKRDYKRFGRLMYISHDGDRIVRHEGRRKVAWDNETTQVTDAYLDRLIRATRSRTKSRRDAAGLMMQPGGYRCSSMELDRLVDIAADVPGVAGAGLTGAGFGGAVLVLVRNQNVPDLLAAIRKRYYRPKGLPFAAEVCHSVAGAGIVDL